MKKHIFCLLLMICVICVLTACGCEHEWVNATCTAPATCSKCGETVGTEQGHNWQEATCTEAKICLTCNAVEQEALGHTWAEETCGKPKTCSVCNATEGEPVSHLWGKATCTEPRTCSRCNVTQGEPASHKWSSVTEEDPTCTVCGIFKSSLIKNPEHVALAEEVIQLFIEPLLRDEDSLTIGEIYGGYKRNEETGEKTDAPFVIITVTGKNSLGTKPTEYVLAWYNDSGYLSYMVSPEKKPDMYTGEFILTQVDKTVYTKDDD